MDWMNIKDKMPPKNTDVLMVTSSRIIVIGDRYEGIWRVPGQTFWKDGELHSYLDDNDILYWMELPELPCDGQPETTSANSLHKHFVMPSLLDFDFKQMRKAKGLTLRKVEKSTGISNAYLSQLETGKIKSPGYNTVKALLELYSNEE